MILFHDGSPPYKNLALTSSGDMPPHVNWIDLVAATAEEIAAVERVIGHHIPTQDELKEIESSSRIRTDHGVLFMSASVVAQDNHHMSYVTPVGFILSGHTLITVRFAESRAFTGFAAAYAEDEAPKSGLTALTGLIDAIIDLAADSLEHAGAELDGLSKHIFGGSGGEKIGKQPPAKETASLHLVVRKIGHNADLSSKIRDSLLGIGRIISYIGGTWKEGQSTELRARLETQRNDIVSLSDYEGHLSNKVQLLLDATMGLINIEQNNIMKVLTIVSVVGVPPTLIASMYGMNFHNMPELNWTYGYEYGLALIAVSAIAPFIWFKKRGWL